NRCRHRSDQRGPASHPAACTQSGVPSDYAAMTVLVPCEYGLHSVWSVWLRSSPSATVGAPHTWPHTHGCDARILSSLGARRSRNHVSIISNAKTHGKTVHPVLLHPGLRS